MATPTTSWRTPQPMSSRSVGWSVVRRRLRVMLTMTTLDDIAIDSPSRAAAPGSRPKARNAATEITM